MEPRAAARFPSLLLVAADAAEASERAPSRLRGGQAAALEIGRLHFDMEAHLVVHFPIMDAATEQVEQFHGDSLGGVEAGTGGARHNASTFDNRMRSVLSNVKVLASACWPATCRSRSFAPSFPVETSVARQAEAPSVVTQA